MIHRGDPAPIRDEFAYHVPTEDQQLYMASVREACSALADIIEQAAVPCRYRSLALTSLEETAMWINKAVVYGHRSRSGVQHFHNPLQHADPATPGLTVGDPIPINLGEVR